jgi:hypothetical protein
MNMNTQRPPTVTVAAILLALLSAWSLVTPLFPTEGIPAFVIYESVALGAFGLFAAYWLWRLKRGSLALTIIAAGLNILLSAPGMFLAPTATLQVSTAVGVTIFALVIVLVALPISRRAHA